MEEKEVEELEEYDFIRYWNFRWFKIEIEVPECDDFGPTGKMVTEHYYELHEVHYDRNNKPCMWTENCTDFQITDAEELIDLMIKCLDATDKKVLLLKNDKLIEIDEYMDKKEIIEQFRKGK